MMKRVVWVHRIGPIMASYRYRAAMPSAEVGKINGFKTSINDGDADIVVFSKPIASDLETAKQAKKDGAKIVVDICDDNFGSVEKSLYVDIAAVADRLVTGTQVMRARLQDYLKRDAEVIGDPYEEPESEPHANGDNLLWFGHRKNFHELQAVLPLLGGRKLRVCTGPKPVPDTIHWTPANMRQAWAMSNIVLLPTMKGNEFKTNNRLINSIRAGCFPICMDHPSYLEFRDLIWVGNFQTGLRWVEAFRGDLDGLVKKAQEHIRERYAPASIGKQWASFLESV